MNKSVFYIPKMDCAAEEQVIRMKIEGNSSVKALNFDLPGRKLEVFHEGEVTPLKQVLSELNWGAKLVSTETEDRLPESVPEDHIADRRMLWTVLYINFGSFLLEIVTGYIARSIGLVADSLDMLADAIVYALSLYAVGKLASSKKRIAGISGYLQLALALFGVIEVARRFISSEESPAFALMIIISLIALAGNAASLFLLQKSKSKEVHIQASYIFTSNDVIVNLGVIAAGLLVYFTHSKIPDLVIGALVFLIVGRGAVTILKLAK